MRLKHWISCLVLLAMLSSIAGWPTAALAEMAEHESESLTLDAGHGEESGKVACQHGCAGHFNQHFSWQPTAAFNLPQGFASEAVRLKAPASHASQPSTPPFRPPRRAAPIQS